MNRTMEFNRLLQIYITGKMNIDEFKAVLDNYYSELLDGFKFREIEYLKIYPLICELQDAYEDDTQSLSERIEYVDSILNGQCNYSAQLYINLGESADIEVLCGIWNQYKSNGYVTKESLDYMEDTLSSFNVDFRRIDNNR